MHQKTTLVLVMAIPVQILYLIFILLLAEVMALKEEYLAEAIMVVTEDPEVAREVQLVLVV